METLPQIPGVTVRRRLAIGGMGELFLAERTGDDGATSTAVLKRLLPGADATHQALFAREGDVLAQLDSPRIVRLLDRGPGWLLLEHVDGVDLATLLAQRARRGRPLSLPAAMAALTGLAAALADLHEAAGPDGVPLGLVHRDVNPANVLIARDGAVKLIDLGVVRTALTDAATVAGVKGTLAYMAPEQLHGRPAGPAADVYAAGLVAYEVLTGVPARPQGDVGLAELLAARDRLPAPPSSVRPKLPTALDAVVLAALARDPGDRPTSARAFAAALLAAGGSPDPVALAAAVDQAAGEGATAASPPPHQTLVAPLAATAAAVSTGGDTPRAPRRRFLWPLAAIGAATVAVLAAFVLPGETPPERVPGAALATVTPPAADAGPLAADASEPMPTAVDTSGPMPTADTAPTTPTADVSVLDAGPEPGPDVTPDPDAAPAVAEDVATPPVATSDAGPSGVHRTDVRSPSVRVAADPGRTVRVVAGVRGPVHVRAGTVGGLAPVATTPLADGAGQDVVLAGGKGPVRLRARLVRRSNMFAVSFNGIDGAWYTMRCGGATHLTPTPAWTIPAGGLACEASAQDGDAIAFQLLPEAP